MFSFSRSTETPSSEDINAAEATPSSDAKKTTEVTPVSKTTIEGKLKVGGKISHDTTELARKSSKKFSDLSSKAVKSGKEGLFMGAVCFGSAVLASIASQGMPNIDIASTVDRAHAISDDDEYPDDKKKLSLT